MLNTTQNAALTGFVPGNTCPENGNIWAQFSLFMQESNLNHIEPMNNASNSVSNPLLAIADLSMQTPGTTPRRQWSAATGLKNTMEIGKAYPGYEKSQYWPRYTDDGVMYWVSTYNRNEAGELHGFYGKSATLEGALVMLNEKLRRYFILGQKDATSKSGITSEPFLSENESSDLRTPFVAA